jgi:hypothetical protein
VADLTITTARKLLSAAGFTLRRDEYGEYRVNFKGANEDSAYYTDDLQDAVLTGLAMRNAVLDDGVARGSRRPHNPPTGRAKRVRVAPSMMQTRFPSRTWITTPPLHQSTASEFADGIGPRAALVTVSTPGYVDYTVVAYPRALGYRRPPRK